MSTGKCNANEPYERSEGRVCVQNRRICTVYLDCQLWEFVEEWKKHCTVTDRTPVLSSIYPPPIKDGTIFRFLISYHCQRQTVPSIKNTGPISLSMVMTFLERSSCCVGILFSQRFTVTSAFGASGLMFGWHVHATDC